MRDTRIGVPWYTREEYPHALQVMEDAHLLPASYEAWLTAAEANIKFYEQQALPVCRVNIQPDMFVEWCRSHALRRDAHARSIFANQQAREGNNACSSAHRSNVPRR